MSLKNIQQKHVATNSTNHFEGVPIFAATKIHERAYDMMHNLNIGKSEPVLVLGAGAGAFEKRLLHHGYNNITAVEFVEGVHQVDEVKLLNIDLNQDFSHIGQFKVIIALEIMEHLENHFHFIREINKMLRDNDSALILSTPNIESSFSRLKYFVFGRLHFFGPLELEGTGHINPILDHILRFNLKLNNLKILELNGNKSVWEALFAYPNKLVKIGYLAFYLISRIERNRNDREINIYLIKRD